MTSASSPLLLAPSQPETTTGWWLACWGEAGSCPSIEPEAARKDFKGTPPLPNGRGRVLRLLGEAELSLPGAAEDKSSGVIFDGVLYNRAELLEQLGDSAGPACSDARLILRAYQRWGEEVLSRLKGIFALIIWDQVRDLLLGVRDRIGIYPLFYAVHGQELVLSTKIPALLRHPGVSRELNRAALADQLCRRWPNPEETFYAAVSRVPPGHVLRVDRTGRRSYRYWDPAPPGTEVNWVCEDQLEQFDQLLAQAVNRCLGLGPAGIYLSGGLDSVSVAAVAVDRARRQGQPAPLALSLIFEHPDCNEEPVQRRVAADLGLPQVIVPLGEAAGAPGLLLGAVQTSSRRSVPLMNTWYPAYDYLGREARRRGCRVILTGTGGDEWLLVSPFLAADLLRRLDVVGLYRLYGNVRRSYRWSRVVLLQSLLWKFGLRPLLGAAARRLLVAAAPRLDQARGRWRSAQATPAWLAPDPALRGEMDRRAAENTPAPTKSSFYLREMRTALDHPLVAMEMEEFFETGECLGLRLLHPYLDADLIDFLYRVPPALLNRGGRTKGLVRQMLARRFPDLGFGDHKKILATSVFKSQMLEEGPGAWQTLGGATALSKLGIVDAPALDATIAAAIANGSPRETCRIWEVLSLEAWVRPRL